MTRSPAESRGLPESPQWRVSRGGMSPQWSPVIVFGSFPGRGGEGRPDQGRGTVEEGSRENCLYFLIIKVAEFDRMLHRALPPQCFTK